MRTGQRHKVWRGAAAGCAVAWVAWWFERWQSGVAICWHWMLAGALCFAVYVLDTSED